MLPRTAVNYGSPMAKRWLVLSASVVLLGFYGCNCGNTITTGGKGGSGGSSSSGGGAGGGGASGGGSGGGSGSCVPACMSGEYCSVLDRCAANGHCLDTGDCTSGEVCDLDGGLCVPGSQCGSTQVNGGQAVPNLIIALDRSCSMTSKINGKTKWQIAYEALTALTNNYQGKIRFGLTMFPDTEAPNCTQDGGAPIPIGDNNEAAIQARLAAAQDAGALEYPAGPCVTNIDTGVEQAAMDPGLMDPNHPGFILLLTDGKQSGCSAGGGNAGTVMAIAMARMMYGVNTFVIGFNANQGGIDVPALDSFADAGGETAPPLPDGGGNLFFDAQDQASLQAALDLIGGRTLSCNYMLTMVPPDPSQLYVFFDKVLQGRDPGHADGWDYNASNNQVTFYGMACDDLKNGTVTKLDIVYGCPTPPIN